MNKRRIVLSFNSDQFQDMVDKDALLRSQAIIEFN